MTVSVFIKLEHLIDFNFQRSFVALKQMGLSPEAGQDKWQRFLSVVNDFSAHPITNYELIKNINNIFAIEVTLDDFKKAIERSVAITPTTVQTLRTLSELKTDYDIEFIIIATTNPWIIQCVNNLLKPENISLDVFNRRGYSFQLQLTGSDLVKHVMNDKLSLAYTRCALVQPPTEPHYSQFEKFKLLLTIDIVKQKAHQAKMQSYRDLLTEWEHLKIIPITWGGALGPANIKELLTDKNLLRERRTSPRSPRLEGFERFLPSRASMLQLQRQQSTRVDKDEHSDSSDCPKPTPRKH